MSMLEVKDLVVSYGAIKALRGISFSVEKGEIISLIGSNGAGKTTTLHSISNIIKKESGTVTFMGEDITNLAPDKIVKKSLIQVPEGRRVFANLTVKENLEMGAFTRTDKADIKKDMDWVFELFPRMKERLRQVSGTLAAVSSRCLLWEEASWLNRCCFCLMNRAWAWLQFWWMRYLTSSRKLARPAPPFCWLSRMHTRRSLLQTVHTFLKQVLLQRAATLKN